jgi:hypothetical protein
VPGHRPICLKQIAPELAVFPLPRLLELWHQMYGELSAERREELLADLAGLAAVIAALGGPEGVAVAAGAIVQVGAWWP